MDQEYRKSARFMGAWLAVVALATLAAVPGWASMAGSTIGSQRMIVAPGCYVLSPGKYDDVSAFCLDQSRSAPVSGAVLSNAPPALGEAVVKSNDGTRMTLQSALAQNMIQLEGIGDDLHVRIRNLTDTQLEICINAPTVVMESGDSYTGDLTKIYAQIVAIFQPAAGKTAGTAEAGAASERDARAKKQEKLWNAVNAVDEAEAKEMNRAMSPDPFDARDSSAPTWYFPRKSKCTGQTGSVEVCAGE